MSTTPRITLSLGLACLAAAGALGLSSPARAGDIHEPPALLMPKLTPVLAPAGETPHTSHSQCHIGPDGRWGLIVTTETVARDRVDLSRVLARTAIYWMGGFAALSYAWWVWRLRACLAKPAKGDRCRRCDYNLTGIRGGSCPECGAVLSERAIVRAGKRRAPKRKLIAPIVLPLAYALGFWGFPETTNSWLVAVARAAPWMSEVATAWFPVDRWPGDRVGDTVSRARHLDLRSGVCGGALIASEDIKIGWSHDNPKVIVEGDLASQWMQGDTAVLWDSQSRRELDRINIFEKIMVHRYGSLELINPQAHFQSQINGDRLERNHRGDVVLSPDGLGEFHVVDGEIAEEWTPHSWHPQMPAVRALETHPIQQGGPLRRFQIPRIEGELEELPNHKVTLMPSFDRRRLYVIWHHPIGRYQELQIFDTVTGDLLTHTPVPGEEPLPFPRGLYADLIEAGDLLLIASRQRGDMAVYHQPTGRWLGRVPIKYEHQAARFVKETGELVIIADMDTKHGATIARFDLSGVLPKTERVDTAKP